MLSLGTSGVYFVVADEFKAKPDQVSLFYISVG
jgi:hypothetical protein